MSINLHVRVIFGWAFYVLGTDFCASTFNSQWAMISQIRQDLSFHFFLNNIWRGEVWVLLECRWWRRRKRRRWRSRRRRSGGAGGEGGGAGRQEVGSLSFSRAQSHLLCNLSRGLQQSPSTWNAYLPLQSRLGGLFVGKGLRPCSASSLAELFFSDAIICSQFFEATMFSKSLIDLILSCLAFCLPASWSSH